MQGRALVIFGPQKVRSHFSGLIGDHCRGEIPHDRHPAGGRAGGRLDTGLIIARRIIIMDRQLPGYRRNGGRAPCRRCDVLLPCTADKIATQPKRSAWVCHRTHGRANPVQAAGIGRKGQRDGIAQQAQRRLPVFATSRKSGHSIIPVQGNTLPRDIRDDIGEGHRAIVRDQLEGQRRNTVAIFGQIHVLEHRQRQPAIGRGAAIRLGTGHQPVDRLILAAPIKGKARFGLEIPGGTAKDFPVRPDSANALDPSA